MTSLNSRQMMEFDARKKSALLAYLLWFFLGWFGVHRFYADRPLSGAVQLVFCLMGWMLATILIGYAFLFVVTLWWIFDGLLIPRWVERYNLRLIDEVTPAAVSAAREASL